MGLKPNVTYNKPDNKVMVRTDGDFIYIISPSEKQTEQVVIGETNIYEARCRHCYVIPKK